jgi:hypothetical protein
LHPSNPAGWIIGVSDCVTLSPDGFKCAFAPSLISITSLTVEFGANVEKDVVGIINELSALEDLEVIAVGARDGRAQEELPLALLCQAIRIRFLTGMLAGAHATYASSAGHGAPLLNKLSLKYTGRSPVAMDDLYQMIMTICKTTPQSSSYRAPALDDHGFGSATDSRRGHRAQDLTMTWTQSEGQNVGMRPRTIDLKLLYLEIQDSILAALKELESQRHELPVSRKVRMHIEDRRGPLTIDC